MMNWLGKWVGRAMGRSIAEPITAIGNVMDQLFTSDDERLDKNILLERLAQRPLLAQVELNKLEAQHRSLFVAGWRPLIGWVLGFSLAFSLIINPILQWYTGQAGPEMPLNTVMSLVMAMLGLSGMRTVEKVTGRAK